MAATSRAAAVEHNLPEPLTRWWVAPELSHGTRALQGIDNAEIIKTVHARRVPMIPVGTAVRL